MRSNARIKHSIAARVVFSLSERLHGGAEVSSTSCTGAKHIS